MVNVVKSNFIEQSNDFLQNLQKATFVAIDEEMTGISTRTSRPRKDQPPCLAWPELKQAPERYQIIQLGVSLYQAADFDEGEVYEWSVRRYNFYMFPSENDRDVVLNPGAVAFLNKHGMSLDLWSQQGVPYQDGRTAKSTIDKLVQEQVKQSQENKTEDKATVQNTVRRRVELTQQDDIQFFARAMAGLREWLDSSVSSNNNMMDDESDNIDPETGVRKDASYMLPTCNSFRRRALYENIQQEYPALILENAGGGQIRVWRLDDQEKLTRAKRLRENAWKHCIVNQCGMYRIFAALSLACRGIPIPTLTSALFAPSFDHVNWDTEMKVHNPGFSLATEQNYQVAPKPIVVHNGFMDLCFLLSHFVSAELPSKFTDCKSMLRSYFPHIYDTKVLATECCLLWKNENSTLQGLFKKIVQENDDHLEERVEVVEQIETIVSNGRIIDNASQEHEAAYDAYMTGMVFIALSMQIHEEHAPHNMAVRDSVTVTKLLTQLWNSPNDIVQRTLYGRNYLYQMSMFTMDLESEYDPPSKSIMADSSYVVKGFDPSITTRDIVRVLSHQLDAEGGNVDFDIVWLDDTSFVAGPVNRTMDVHLLSSARIALVAQEHGDIIHGLLKKRFQRKGTNEPEASIILLKDYLQSTHTNSTEKSGADSQVASTSTVWSKLLHFFGFGNKTKRAADSSNSDTVSEPSAKRARIH